tara:strand:+ start:170 stop:970 length:801 start_codon:yes stop_codon:yes gene_type:complete
MWKQLELSVYFLSEEARVFFHSLDSAQSIKIKSKVVSIEDVDTMGVDKSNEENIAEAAFMERKQNDDNAMKNYNCSICTEDIMTSNSMVWTCPGCGVMVGHVVCSALEQSKDCCIADVLPCPKCKKVFTRATIGTYSYHPLRPLESKKPSKRQKKDKTIAMTQLESDSESMANQSDAHTQKNWWEDSSSESNDDDDDGDGDGDDQVGRVEESSGKDTYQDYEEDKFLFTQTETSEFEKENYDNNYSNDYCDYEQGEEDAQYIMTMD